MIPSTGLSSNIGGPTQPLPREIEASAWTMVNKAALGIVPDTLELPFSKVGGDIYKYKSDSSRPSLKPMGSDRTLASEDSVDTHSWKAPFERLVNLLPAPIRNRLLAEMGKPFDMRNGDYLALESTLFLTAEGFAALDEAQKPKELEGARLERMLHNQGLAGRALRGIVQQGEQTLGGVQYFLNKMGPNFAQHDALRGFAHQAADLQEDLAEVLQIIQEGHQPDMEGLTDLANRATSLSNLFSRMDRGNDMQLLSPLLQAMAAVASALALTPTTPSLFFGLKMGTKGLFKGDSSTGLLGPELQALLKALMGGVLPNALKGAGIAKQQMLLMLLLETLSGAGTLGALIGEFGFGTSPAKGGEDAKRATRRFEFALLLKMIASSGIFKALGATIADASGVKDAKAADFISSLTELLSLFTIAFGGSKNMDETEVLLRGLEGELLEDVEQLESHVKTQEDGQGAHIALLQAKKALEQKDIQGFIGAVAFAFALGNTTLEDTHTESAALKDLSILLQKTCRSGAKEMRPITQMIVAG